MRRFIFAAIIAGSFIINVPMATACGDKALRIGRGVRFQRTLHPAAVLIYLPSNATRASQLQSVLRKAGHKAYVASGAGGLNSALHSGQYDLVFTDLAEAQGLEKQLQNASLKSILVPVLANGTKAEVTAAKKQYGYVVKNPHSADHYLDAIDGAMQSRVRLLAKKA